MVGRAWKDHPDPSLVVGGLVTIWLAILRLGRTNSMSAMHSRASHTGLMARTIPCGGSHASRHLSVTSRVVLAAARALPEWCAADSLGVVVLWAGTVTLLGLVMAGEHELHDRGDEEEEDVEDRHREAGGVQAADVAPVPGTRSGFTGETLAEGRVDNALARVCAMAGVVCDGGEAADEAEVEEDGDEGEESNAAEEQGE